MTYTTRTLVLNAVKTMKQPVTPSSVRRKMVEMGYKRIPMTGHINCILRDHCTRDYDGKYVIYFMEEEE